MLGQEKDFPHNADFIHHGHVVCIWANIMNLDGKAEKLLDMVV